MSLESVRVFIFRHIWIFFLVFIFFLLTVQYYCIKKTEIHGYRGICENLNSCEGNLHSATTQPIWLKSWIDTQNIFHPKKIHGYHGICENLKAASVCLLDVKYESYFSTSKILFLTALHQKRQVTVRSITVTLYLGTIIGTKGAPFQGNTHVSSRDNEINEIPKRKTL